MSSPLIQVKKSTFDLSGKGHNRKPLYRKFKVTLNWYGENRIFYTSCSSEKGALRNAIRKLSLSTGVQFSAIQVKLFSNRNAYKIEEI